MQKCRTYTDETRIKKHFLMFLKHKKPKADTRLRFNGAGRIRRGRVPRFRAWLGSSPWREGQGGEIIFIWRGSSPLAWGSGGDNIYLARVLPPDPASAFCKNLNRGSSGACPPLKNTNCWKNSYCQFVIDTRFDKKKLWKPINQKLKTLHGLTVVSWGIWSFEFHEVFFAQEKHHQLVEQQV